jgi:hypothetical protein
MSSGTLSLHIFSLLSRLVGQPILAATGFQPVQCRMSSGTATLSPALSLDSQAFGCGLTLNGVSVFACSYPLE